jgi:hypothetical protein
LRRDGPPDRVAARRLDVAEVEVLRRDAAADELGLEDVDHGLHAEVVVGRQQELRLRAVELDLRAGPLKS